MYIDDCVKGIDMIMHCDDLIATPINLGSSELVSINELLTKIEKIAGVKLKRQLRPERAAGRGRPQLRQHVHQESAQVGAEHDRWTKAWRTPTSGSRNNITTAKPANAWASADENNRFAGRRNARLHSQPPATGGRLD